jgi:DNA-binding CsgD family transcriptional regulator
MDTLISTIYAAGADRVPWSEPLDVIARTYDLWGAQIVGVDKRNGSLVFSAGSTDTPPEVELDYVRYYHSINPRVGPSMALGLDGWMHCHEHFDDHFVANDRFYQEFLIPHGGRYLSGTKLQEDADFVYMLGLMRGVGRQPLQQEAMQDLHAIKLHLAEALKNFEVLGRAYAQLDAAQELFSRFSYPMLLIDERRTILFANEHARTLLDAGRGLSERSGLLACSQVEPSNELTEAVRSLSLLAATAKRRVIRVSDAYGRHVNLLVSAVLPELSMQVFGSRPRAVVMIHDPQQSVRTIDPVIAAECFSLTPAEARVAVKLAQGLTVKEIAAAHCTSIATVRTQVQSVFTKTGVERQAELVRRLLDIPA